MRDRSTAGRIRILRASWIAFALALSSWSTPVVHAAGEVDAIETSDEPASRSAYTVDGIAYEWGLGTNLVLEGFVAGGERYASLRRAERIEIRGGAADDAAGSRCGLFAESVDGSSTRLAPDFAELAGGGGNCDTAAILTADLVNRGALDLFSNRPPTTKDVERVDFLFPSGINAPVDAASGALAGHLVGDKSGNNPLRMAAILALDASGLPSAYGPLVRVAETGCADPDLCYGVTGPMQTYVFLQSGVEVPPGPPAAYWLIAEPAAFAFVSATALGLDAGQRYHGVSLFPDDVNAAVHDPLDPSTFPDDTEDAGRSPGDSVDLHGGGAHYYVADAARLAAGRVSCAAADGGEATGRGDVGVFLHEDGNGNGVLDSAERDVVLGDSAVSGPDGGFAFVGLGDGTYFLRVGVDDTDSADGSPPTSIDPLPFVIAGADARSLDVVLDCSPAGDPGPPFDDPACLDAGESGRCVIETELDGHGLGRARPALVLVLLVLLVGRGWRRPRRAPGEGRS